MATLTIRQLDDDVYDALREQARVNGRSIEAEVRHQLGQLLSRRRKADAFERFIEATKTPLDPGPDYPGSVALIRQIRDEE